MIAKPLREVTSAEADAFTLDGFVVLVAILEPDTLGVLEPVVDRILASSYTRDVTAEALEREAMVTTAPGFRGSSRAVKSSRRGHFILSYNTARREPVVRDFALSGALGRIAATLLRSTSIRYCDDLLLAKEPYTREETEWHDDEPFSLATGAARCSLWCPLDDVPARAGALRYLQGSHLRFADWRTRGNDARTLAAEHCRDVVTCPVRRGDIIAHHPATIHSAGPNRTARRRRALALRLAGESARFVLPPARDEPADLYGLAEGAPLDGPQFPLAWPIGGAEP